MTVTDTPSPAVTELGVGRPVLVLGAASGSPGLAALAARFNVFAMADDASAAAWVGAQGFEALGGVGIGDAAGRAGARPPSGPAPRRRRADGGARLRADRRPRRGRRAAGALAPCAARQHR